MRRKLFFILILGFLVAGGIALAGQGFFNVPIYSKQEKVQLCHYGQHDGDHLSEGTCGPGGKLLVVPVPAALAHGVDPDDCTDSGIPDKGCI